jgi:hypothetical protein
VGLGCVLALTLALAEVHAQPTATDRESARALMAEGDKAYAAKDYPAALRSYQGAHALVALSSTAIWVARTLVQLGQLVEARDIAIEATRLPVKPAEPPPVVRARADAEKLAQELATRIPSIQIQIEGPPAGSAAEVRIDGAAIPAAAAALPRKVNPGKHSVAASAAGFSSATTEVVVKEGETLPVKLTLVPEASGAPPPVAVVTTTPPASAAPAASTAPPPPSDSAGSGTPPLVYVGFIVGGVGIAAGTVTGILSLSRASNVEDEHCNDDEQCSPKAEPGISQARGLAWASNIGFAVGVAGVAVGVVALLTSRSKDPPAPPASAWVRPAVGPGSVGLTGGF